MKSKLRSMVAVMVGFLLCVVAIPAYSGDITSVKQGIDSIRTDKKTRIVTVDGPANWSSAAVCTDESIVYLDPAKFSAEAFREQLAVLVGAHLAGREVQLNLRGCGNILGIGNSPLIKDITVF